VLVREWRPVGRQRRVTPGRPIAGIARASPIGMIVIARLPIARK